MQKLIIPLSKFSVEIEAEHETDLFKKAAFWLSLPANCPICKSSLILDYRTPKTFEYYDLKCQGPRPHTVSLGESKGTHDLYFDSKKTWTEAGSDRPVASPDASRDPNAGGGVVVDVKPEPEPRPEPKPAIQYGAQADRSAKLNVLIKLISDCRSAGIVTNLSPADVAKLSDEDIVRQTERIAALFANSPLNRRPEQ